MKMLTDVLDDLRRELVRVEAERDDQMRRIEDLQGTVQEQAEALRRVRALPRYRLHESGLVEVDADGTWLPWSRVVEALASVSPPPSKEEQ